ncbi:DUF262 domain-containing protein [Phytohabitans kaempferiae]|uniref:DUF262 domain-containing protein n=1 Tax=Phytohabitans kaempferiae TaxID=1620943 RepID=A0ABV6LWH2_9ACTN
MADPTNFGHDRLAHLLSDRLLKVPRFQRSYSWDDANVKEFLDDLENARSGKQSYFMGTVVLASDTEHSSRQLIVDGQQRLTTTAILLVAIRDRLKQLGKHDHANAVDETYLRRFELMQEERVTRLILNPVDAPSYERMLSGKSGTPNHPVVRCYEICKGHLMDLAPGDSDYKILLDMVDQLERRVQVLLALASELSEAYVIFETLNDRGAELTTADLLKNYLFSQAGRDYLALVERSWTTISSAFDKADDLVKFIRYEYMSIHGKVTMRNLYKSLQGTIGKTPVGIREYLLRLERALVSYLALREPDNSHWTGINTDVRDSLMANRRFGFESSTPLLLAAFRSWETEKAAKLVNKVTGWSIRSVVGGKIGGGQSEEAFCAAALAVAGGKATTQDQVRSHLSHVVPNDEDFTQAIQAYGPLSLARAKYLLARIERQIILAGGGNAEGLPDWSSTSVSVEHILADSMTRQSFESDDEFTEFATMRARIHNLTLLEKSLNRNLADKPFVEKRETYSKSKFTMTRQAGEPASMDVKAIRERGRLLARYAPAAWPL